MSMTLERILGRRPLPAPPIDGPRDSRRSVIHSSEPVEPCADLLQLLTQAATKAQHFDVEGLAARCDAEFAAWVRTWPGEHYRLLGALAKTLRPSTIVEVGTFKGHDALALSLGHPEARVVTYDIVPWQEIAGSALRATDFAEGRMEQRLGDLAEPQFLESQLEILRSAGLIFVDGPKDGHWERRFCDLVLPELTDRRRVVVFDDIRLLEMVQLWHDLTHPRLDATSFGHWSGTGILHTI
jgi:predicted O-methyltransferase YrrM